LSALASFLQMIANLIAQAAGHVLGYLAVDLFFVLLGFLAHLLPPVPDPPTWYTDALAPYLGILNTFFPVSEVLTAASVWAAVYGAIFLYKGVKFLRGGG